MQEILFDYFLEYLSENNENYLYAIFDGVKHPMLYSGLKDGVLLYEILFREEYLRRELEEVAPYLIELDFKSAMGKEQTKELLSAYRGNGCIFMAGKSDLIVTIEAMRELFYVYTAEGTKGYMRFYDPEVFIDYILQKEDNIRYALFRDVECYWHGDIDDASMMHQYIKTGTYTYIKQSISLKQKGI